MNDLDVLWAGWRSDYVSGVASDQYANDVSGADDIVVSGKERVGEHRRCVMCALAAVDTPSVQNGVVWHSELVTVALNAYPYSSGHLLVLPNRHTDDLTTLKGDEPVQLFKAFVDAMTAIDRAYHPEAVNFGANLGRFAGAGIPEHLHFHIVPRWAGDTNFMTAIANTRVIPESLEVSWEKLSGAWPLS